MRSTQSFAQLPLEKIVELKKLLWPLLCCHRIAQYKPQMTEGIKAKMSRLCFDSQTTEAVAYGTSHAFHVNSKFTKSVSSNQHIKRLWNQNISTWIFDIVTPTDT